jgi:16S rRNA G966 N2-methylase RsmD
MNRDLFLGDRLPEFIFAPRTDPIYNAHGYLTKVPVDGILPYLTTFTSPGETVVDMFAGSGMTAVAAKIAGRSAIVSDISVLGQHIGEGYLAEVDAAEFARMAAEVVTGARARFLDLYETDASAGRQLEAIRTIWSFVYRCASCANEIVYFDALRSGDWKTPSTCPHCLAVFSKKSASYLGDTPVLVVVAGQDGRQIELPITEADKQKIKHAESHPDLANVPSKPIEPNREMYRRSALGKWDLRETKRFFSARNALALYYIWEGIRKVSSESLKKKLQFAFTAILPRASRRYQWSAQRPLNAATQTYYISPVYYEWNVFELFERKVRASIRADDEIRARRAALRIFQETTHRYIRCSASKLSHLEDESADFVFTDPPFGSNLFYADMSLFHEAWLDTVTDDTEEAVIHTNGKKAIEAAQRYEALLRAACTEAYRILKPGRFLSLVFGNSSGRIWSMVQQILLSTGFESRPAHIGILDKGQRSVKGLASGFENVSTLDLVLTVRKPSSAISTLPAVNQTSIGELIEEVLSTIDFHSHQTPSHIYLTVLKEAFERQLPVDALHLSEILDVLRKRDIRVDTKSGEFVRGV